MSKKKILITVITYPLPSRSYDELVCTAGITDTGEWIRLYPVPLSFIIDLKDTGRLNNIKYTWIELEVEKRKGSNDFRPESYSPKYYDFRDLKIIERLDTKSNWLKRKEHCLFNVYTDLSRLINESKKPNNKSLATYKPKKIISFEWEADDREWKDVWKEIRKQGDLFNLGKSPEILIPKLPYKFFYKFEDTGGNVRRLMIEDWELGSLYWNCLKRSDGDELLALQKVKEKYETLFLKNNDIYLFLGTTKEWHMRRSKNPFVIIGVFYPKKEFQTRMF